MKLYIVDVNFPSQRKPMGRLCRAAHQDLIPRLWVQCCNPYLQQFFAVLGRSLSRDLHARH